MEKWTADNIPTGIKYIHQNSRAITPPMLVSPLAIELKTPVIGMIKQLRKKIP